MSNKYRFTSNYPTLSPLVRALSATTFKTDLETSARERFELLLGYSTSFKHVVKFPRKSGYGARIFLGGKQMTIALGSPAQAESIARWADMAQVVFWKYRIRKSENLDPADFNTSTTQAQDDLKQHADMREIFSQFVVEFGKLGMLPSDEIMTRRRALAARPRVSSSLREQSEQMHSDVLKLDTRITALETQIAGCEKQLSADIERVIRRLEKHEEDHLLLLVGRGPVLDNKLAAMYEKLELLCKAVIEIGKKI